MLARAVKNRFGAANVTYLIVDRDTNSIVSEVVLPDRSNQFSRVEMRLKIARLSSVLQIGTFEANGAFEPAEFLSVRSELNPSSSNGPRFCSFMR